MRQPTKERKELGVGETFGDALKMFEEKSGQKFDENKHDLTFDEATKLWSVFHKRKNHDRTIKRSITRETRDPYANAHRGRDRRPVVITMTPREMVETRLKGTRTTFRISIHDLHGLLVRRHAFNVARIHAQEKAARRKAAKAARKARQRK